MCPRNCDSSLKDSHCVNPWRTPIFRIAPGGAQNRSEPAPKTGRITIQTHMHVQPKPWHWSVRTKAICGGRSQGTSPFGGAQVWTIGGAFRPPFPPGGSFRSDESEQELRGQNVDSRVKCRATGRPSLGAGVFTQDPGPHPMGFPCPLRCKPETLHL